ncbi:MAG: Sjogren's syndrome/scleroderma autoantigen 1 family protein [Acidilobaceae archaeon]
MSEKHREEEVQKKMIALLRAGATMLAESCPLDGYPLFRLKSGEIVCPLHGRVFVVSSESEAEEVEIDYVVSKIALYAARKAYETLSSNGDPDDIRAWLSVLEAAERVRSLRLQAKSHLKQAEAKGESRG